jgi:hypothetical protein
MIFFLLVMLDAFGCFVVTHFSLMILVLNRFFIHISIIHDNISSGVYSKKNIRRPPIDETHPSSMTIVAHLIINGFI